MNDTHDSFRGETGTLAERTKYSLAEELQITRWWLRQLQAMVEASPPKSADVLLGALNEFRCHLGRCYELEEEQGLSSDEDIETPTFVREERRLLDQHQGLAGRLAVLLSDLRLHADEKLDEIRASLSDFLEDCRELDLEETHFVQRVTYAEFSAQD